MAKRHRLILAGTLALVAIYAFYRMAVLHPGHQDRQPQQPVPFMQLNNQDQDLLILTSKLNRISGRVEAIGQVIMHLTRARRYLQTCVPETELGPASALTADLGFVAQSLRDIERELEEIQSDLKDSVSEIRQHLQLLEMSSDDNR